jgi:hypothetical protein
MIAKGANVLLHDSHGQTPLHVAASKGHEGVIRVLALKGGVELLCMKSLADRTAADEAAFGGHKNAKKMLLQLADDMIHREKIQLQMTDISKTMTKTYAVNQNEPLTAEEYEKVVFNMLMCMLPSVGHDNETLEQKFVAEAHELICGEFGDAAHGYFKLMKVNENEVRNRAVDGVPSIFKEVRELEVDQGRDEVMEHLKYILDEHASEKLYPNGMRDKGRAGMTIDDFMEHEFVKKADLTKAQVVALRLYTTSAFKYINGPLRDPMRKEPHPLPVTVTLIAQGILNLRRIHGEANAVETTVLWRGLKNMTTSNEFGDKGGTEVRICKMFLISFFLFTAHRTLLRTMKQPKLCCVSDAMLF